MNIYLDNACTTFPKPPRVAEAVSSYILSSGANVNRGSYGSAFDAEDAVMDCREALAGMFGAPDPAHVVFTRGVTESLNLVLKGLLKPGDHVVVSSMEHNSVMRPLVQLAAERGVAFTRVQCVSDGTLDPANVEAAINPATRLVVMTHASNVCGTVLPLADVGEMCASHGVPLIVDSAQTAGLLPAGLGNLGASAVCFAGHKGLLGPQGIGGVVFSAELAERVEPLVAGGTGSFSDSEETPPLMPDKFEAGTLNLPGIMGLRASLGWIAEQVPGSLYAHELALTRRFLDGLAPLEAAGDLRVVGLLTASPGERVGVVSVVPLRRDPAAVAFDLDARHGIQTRVGLHCSPSAHKTLGTFPGGTVRFSFGFANTDDDVDAALAALAESCAPPLL